MTKSGSVSPATEHKSTQFSEWNVLVTGGNAGLGLETAALLGEQGFGHITIGARSREKAQDAVARLVQRTRRDCYSYAIFDVSDVKASVKAARKLARDGHVFDLVILNAGTALQTLSVTPEGIEGTIATSLAGHHAFTMTLLEEEAIAEDGRNVISGSEGARGNFGPFKVLGYHERASTHHRGLEGVMDDVISGRAFVGKKYSQMPEYGNAKLWVAWWAAALSRRLASDQLVFAVSPGSNMGTTFKRNAPGFLRCIFPCAAVMMTCAGMNGPTSDGAQRYIDAGTLLGSKEHGKFLASPEPKKMIGPLTVQQSPHFHDRELQDASWHALVRATGVGLPLREVSSNTSSSDDSSQTSGPYATGTTRTTASTSS